MRLANLTAAGTTTYSLPFTPEFIGVSTTTDVTSISVNVLGVGNVVKLSGTGIARLSAPAVDGGNTMKMLKLSDGLNHRFSCTITITTAGVGPIELRYFSSQKTKNENLFYTYSETLCQQNTNQTFKNFVGVDVSNAAATDEFSMVTADGMAEQGLTEADLGFLGTLTHGNDANMFATIWNIPRRGEYMPASIVRELTAVNPSADFTAYLCTIIQNR